MDQMRPVKPFPTFIMGFPAMVTLLALGFALPLTIQAWTFIADSDSVTAEVTDMRETVTCSERRRPDSRIATETVCSTIYFPTVRYTTLSGERLENEVMSFLNDPGLSTGDEVAVRYVRDDPILVQIDRWRVNWGLPLGLWGGVVVFGGAFAGMVWVNRRARRSGRMVPGFAPDPPPLWVTLVTLFFPFILSLLTALLASDTIDFYRNSRLTTAEVVQPMVESTDHPVLRFTDQFGQQVTGQTETNPFDTLNVAGRIIDVRHRLDDPAKFRAAVTSMSIWWPTVTVALFAAVFSFAFIGALVFMARGG